MALEIIKTTITDGSVKETDLYKVLSNKTALNTVSDEILVDNVDYIGIAIVTSGAVSGGVVTIEGSPTPGYGGTWLTLRAVTCNTPNKIFGQGIDSHDQLGLSACRYIRARISTIIANGSVDVYLGITKI